MLRNCLSEKSHSKSTQFRCQDIYQTFIILHVNVPGHRVVEVELRKYLAADAQVGVAAGEDDLMAQRDDLSSVGYPPLY